ncbi:uncharacterized protein [Nicotiana sylvestris]|uniref:uncharacterized protein n=1 Tax=Nicotiana sylvestris TaxID=4096 RepID=UPI00388C4F25
MNNRKQSRTDFIMVISFQSARFEDKELAARKQSRRRTEYAARKRRLSEISSAKPSDQSHSSSESHRMIPGQAATFIRDIPSSSRNGRTSTQVGCWNINQLPSCPSVLKGVPNCKFCGARRFQYETPSFCYSNGSVKLVSQRLPSELKSLYFGVNDQSNHFRIYIRTYNMFTFTSLGVKYDKELAKRTQGVYTFRVQGQMYHFINDLTPRDNKAKNLQFYFYDNDEDIVNKMAFSEKLDRSVIAKLMNILKINSYSIFLKSLTDIPDLSNFYIALKCDSTLDQRTYNLPSVSEVATIWVDEELECSLSTSHIRIYTHSNSNQLVHYCYGCYNPLQYPLLFPYGENGWHCDIQKVQQKTSSPTPRASCKHEKLPSVTNMCSIDGLLNIEQEILKKERKKKILFPVKNITATNFKLEMMKKMELYILEDYSNNIL